MSKWTLERIQSEVDGLVDRMVARGLGSPVAEYHVNAHTQNVLMLRYRVLRTERRVEDDTWEFIREDEIGMAFRRAIKWIDAIPSVAEMKRQAALKKVLAAVEAAREAGLDAELVNPLVEVAEKLASNALEDRRP